MPINMTPSWEYHKGRLCVFKYMLCQEGYCARCVIFRQHQSGRLRQPAGRSAASHSDGGPGSGAADRFSLQLSLLSQTAPPPLPHCPPPNHH